MGGKTHTVSVSMQYIKAETYNETPIYTHYNYSLTLTPCILIKSQTSTVYHTLAYRQRKTVPSLCARILTQSASPARYQSHRRSSPHPSCAHTYETEGMYILITYIHIQQYIWIHFISDTQYIKTQTYLKWKFSVNIKYYNIIHKTPHLRSLSNNICLYTCSLRQIFGINTVCCT